LAFFFSMAGFVPDASWCALLFRPDLMIICRPHSKTGKHVHKNPTRAYERLLQLLKHRPPEDVDVAGLLPSDWNDILDVGHAHGVMPLLHHRLSLQKLPVPLDVSTRLQEATISTGFRNTKLYHELGQILKQLGTESISVVVLKGGHLAELVYENIGLRPMDDVDLLVHKHDLAKTEEVLLDLGYVHPEESVSATSPHHLPPFRKSGSAPLEVHWTIPLSGLFRIDMEEIWRRARSVTIAGGTAYVLDPVDLLLHLCLHASVHHRFGIGVRPLCDIAETLRKYENEVAWGELTQRSNAWGIQTAVYLTLCVVAELLGEPSGQALEVLKPNGFDSRLIGWAKNQTFCRSRELGERTAISPRMAEFRAAPLQRKVQLLLRAAFPPTEEVARMYHLPLRSPRIYFYYPLRLAGLLASRGGAAWRLARGEKNAVSAAEMYELLLDRPGHTP
jgi:hypothetical protein